MKKPHKILLFATVLLLVASIVYTSAEEGWQKQRRERPSWEIRSPSVGKIVPDIPVYDMNLKPVQFSNLYKNSLLIVQWGGCT
ncbi:hypothetical protein ACFLT9_06060 [Acidobacteriota bacterium]